jgi:hypothetical protein
MSNTTNYATNNTTDRKTFAIGILSLTATVLLLGNYFAPRPALATTTIKDRDFSMVTAAQQTGGDSLYVLDNRSGRVAVYAYDPSSRVIRPRASGEMTTLFAGK